MGGSRKYALIPVGIFSRPEFRGLGSRAQLVYFVIRSWPGTNRAGVTPLMPEEWVTSASMTAEDVAAAVDVLAASGLAVVDHEHRELFMPDCIRHERVGKQPNVLERAIREAEVCRSPRVRLAVARELRAVGSPRAREAADYLERGERVPDDPCLRNRHATSTRPEIKRLRRQFIECAGRRRLRAEINAGLHVCGECSTAENLQVDHIVALARGGTNDFSNLQVLCAPCNNRKGAR